MTRQRVNQLANPGTGPNGRRPVRGRAVARDPSLVSEDLLRRVAHVAGEQSAAAKALAEIAARRERGEEPFCFQWTVATGAWGRLYLVVIS